MKFLSMEIKMKMINMTVVIFPLNRDLMMQLYKNNIDFLIIFNMKKDTPKSVLHSVIQIRYYLR